MLLSFAIVIQSAAKGGMNNVVDNFCNSLDPLVGGLGFELHDGWIYSLATRPRRRCTDN